MSQAPNRMQFTRPSIQRPGAPAQTQAPVSQAPAVQAPAGQEGGVDRTKALKFFGGLNKIRGSKDANYARPGHYLMKIRGLKIVTTQTSKDDLLIWEMTCLHVYPETESYEPMPKSRNNPALGVFKPHVVGEELAWAINAKNLPAQAVTKTAVCNLLYGGDEALMDSQVTDEDMLQLFSPENPLAMMIVEYDARMILTKGKSEPFTKVSLRREVPYEEAIATIDPNVLALQFPGGADYLRQVDAMLHQQQEGQAPTA